MSTKILTIGIVVFCVLIVGAYYVAKDNKGVENPTQASIINNSNKQQPTQARFNGEEGRGVTLVDGKVTITEDEFNGNEANYYNTTLSSGKTVYYFVVQDKQGNYRAAANACQVCFDERKGFHQEGDYMVCNTCGSKYPLNKIATEKGGCNPGPINPNLEVANGNVIIEETDLKEVEFFF
ncbi:MAG: DUF2318 domain-containing protein [Parcubacteria group bacterium]|nr:DUF2318 domain-containing protein [Parcubacteria group bacterium]